MRTDEVPFQLTQRADFFEEEVGLRDHPSSGRSSTPAMNRMRTPRSTAGCMITGDANLSEVQTFLARDHGVGARHDRGRRPRRALQLARPVAAMQAVSWDLSLAEPLEMADGSAAPRWTCSGTCTAGPATPSPGDWRCSVPRLSVKRSSPAGSRCSRVWTETR